MKAVRFFALVIVLLSIAPPIQAKPIKKPFYSGTGFFINQMGYIVTNQHVVNNCKDIYVKGSVPRVPAALVAVDNDNDLALLKVGFTPRGYARIRSKENVRLNERVMIVGYPNKKGLSGQYTITNANILEKEGPAGEKDWIQFTDSASRGNSGGPLIDKNGDVIGVVRAKVEFYQLSYLSNGVNVNTMTDSELKKLATPVRSSDIAISSNALESFLEKNVVDYRKSDNAKTASNIEERTARYIVNVSCEVE